MNLNSLWTEIELDQKWRLDEIRFFQNLINDLKKDSEKDQFRRALILLLYAHFEGFTKFVFLVFIKAVNQENLKCNQVNYSIASATLSHVFASMRNPDKKCPIFRRKLPEDRTLHRFARDKEFLEQINEIDNTYVNIDEDVSDSESNLKPEILQKILFRLGFDHTLFEEQSKQIPKLLNYRNDIAHGKSKDGITEEEYFSIRDDVFFIINQIKKKIMGALTDKVYMRRNSK